MREILFRGKRTDNDEWIKGYLHKIDGEGKGYRAFAIQVQDIDSYMCRPHSHEVQPKPVGQFTGLTDKNGTKIFEGDIVKITYNDRLTRRLEKEDYESYMKEFCLVEQVVFYKGAFCSKVEIEDIPLYRPLGFDLYAKSMLKELEVIGNIYDNPELLGE